MTSLRPSPVQRDLGSVLSAGGVDYAGAPIAITGVTHDSGSVRPGDLFIARPGIVTHGAAYAVDAVARGAVAVVTDDLGAAMLPDVGVPVVISDSPRAAMGKIAAEAYGQPASRVLMLGVTGTNGKTTTTVLMASGLRAAGHRVGLIGTAGIVIDGESVPSPRTTPESSDLHAILALMVERGVTAVAMEVSSHALALDRVEGVLFDIACFTNLTQDHLDFHGSMDDYFEAKSRLFSPDRSRRAVIGVDDEWGRRLAQRCGIPAATWSLTGAADWHATGIVQAGGGSQRIAVTEPDGQRAEIEVGLPGRFNAANAVAAYAVLRTAGVSPEALVTAFAGARVPGRMEIVESRDDATYVVDYAHSPDAVERVLSEVRAMTAGRVIAVIGCGGDRDRDKRPMMGAIASRLSDRVIVTDDNPRSEDPARIRASMLAGVDATRADRVMDIGDRRTAIRHAVSEARAGDVVVVLGKGHETGQEIGGVVHPFDDRDELRAAIAGAGA